MVLRSSIFDSKCFDTIGHDVLMLKLEKYGVKGNVLSCLKSYLSDRTQLVKCDTSVSKSLPVIVDVPSIFVNDFPTCLRESQGNMFADDIVCYAQDGVQSYIYIDVHNANTWYNHNKLTLNNAKSGCMLLGALQRLHNNSNI